MLSKKEIDELKKKVEPIKKLAMHDDADGLTAGVLMSYVFKINKVWSPEDFGVWPIAPYKDSDGQDEIPPDACVDMVPQNPEWQGLCIDHHPGHVEEGKRKYQLITGDMPAGVLVYTLFREQIPAEQRWKVAVSAVGDGAPELIPKEIWRDFPILLEDAISTWQSPGKQLETSSMPLYMRLTSGLNSMCKIQNQWYQAYSILRNAKSPWALIQDDALNKAKEWVKSEQERIIRNDKPVGMRNGIRLWVFKSDMKVERSLAWQLWEKDFKTVVAVNTQTNRGSIRGVLATLIYETLTNNGFKANGHPGFGGLQLKPTQTVDDLYKALSSIKV